MNWTKTYSAPSHSGVGVLWEQGRLDEFLLVSAIAVWWVSGVLAATQPSFGVLLRDEAQRHQALGFSLVGSITERLRQKDGRNTTVIEDLKF